MVSKSVDRNVSNDLKLTIQPAQIEDIKVISSVLAKSFYDFPEFAHWIYPILQFTINEDLRYRLRSHSPRYACLVAKLARPDSQDIIVGTAEIALRSTSFWQNQPKHPYISNLAVKQEYRRLGIGSQLLNKCEQIALDWGYHETRLHVLDCNNSAKQLYCCNGYQILPKELNWGMWFDCSSRLLLTKKI